MTDGCALCKRVLPDEYMTRHHLRPGIRSEFAMICQPCHKQVHAIFTNHELRHEYNDIESIRENREMAKFIGWIEDTNKTDVQVSESEKVRRWR